jgi:hypothetical protein
MEKVDHSRHRGCFADEDTTREGVRALVLLDNRLGVEERIGDSSALRMNCKGAKGEPGDPLE